MFPGMNPNLVKQAMKKMGIKQEEIDAKEVIIRTDDKELVIKNPSVVKIEMGGEESFQVSGSVEERELSTEAEISEDDVKTVMEQAECSEKEARKAIEDNKGDLAKAIMELQNK